ncbi:MAG: hypothetical protein ACTS27_10385 [Phycisphaerales bacterium]
MERMSTATAFLGFALASVASAQSTLTQGEAFIEADAFAGSGGTSVTIQERRDWDELGSSFVAEIVESETYAPGLRGDTPSGATIVDQITQDTQILGLIGGAFRGVRTHSTAFGRILKTTDAGVSAFNFVDSSLVLRFRVDGEGFEYSLRGEIESSDVGDTTSELTCWVRFRRFTDVGLPAETVINTRASRPSPEFPFSIDLEGPLTPGNWVFDVVIDGSVAIEPGPSDETSEYSANITLLVKSPCAGDTNGDNTVNFADLNAVLSSFGQTGFGLPGDVNLDEQVNFLDLNEVLSSFGDTCE